MKMNGNIPHTKRNCLCGALTARAWNESSKDLWKWRGHIKDILNSLEQCRAL